MYFFAAMPCCFFFIKMILTSIQNVLVTICTKHDEQKPHVFLFVCPPKFLELAASLSASGGFRSRGFPSRSREYIVSFAFSEGRYIRHPSSLKTIRVFFLENEPKGKQSSWGINSRIQLS